jgi:dipeptidyl aminopeptidase/acylaminoacyl peptidase
VLVTHGTADDEDLPERTEELVADAVAAGIPVSLHWCEGAGHGRVDDVCPDEYATWVRDFFLTASGQS